MSLYQFIQEIHISKNSFWPLSDPDLLTFDLQNLISYGMGEHKLLGKKIIKICVTLFYSVQMKTNY